MAHLFNRCFKTANNRLLRLQPGGGGGGGGGGVGHSLIRA